MGRKVFHEVRNCGIFRAELVSHKTISVRNHSTFLVLIKVKKKITSYSITFRPKRIRNRFLVYKKKAALWSRRLNVVLCAYQELLMTLNGSESILNSSRVLKSNVFYVSEYREMCLVLLLNYKENQHSLTYLKDLVETNHIFLKLFEQFAKSYWHLAVQKKFSKEEQTEEKETPPPTFNEIALEISSALQEKPSLTDDVVHFDADLPIDDQR
jgi:timeless